jgi:hypothetical protein
MYDQLSKTLQDKISFNKSFIEIFSLLSENNTDNVIFNHFINSFIFEYLLMVVILINIRNSTKCGYYPKCSKSVTNTM